MKNDKLINKTNTQVGKFYGLIDTFALWWKSRGHDDCITDLLKVEPNMHVGKDIFEHPVAGAYSMEQMEAVHNKPSVVYEGHIDTTKEKVAKFLKKLFGSNKPVFVDDNI